MHLGMCANIADVHRVPWSADCWALNCIPKIFWVLLAWHRAAILPPKSAEVERINLGRPRPRFDPASAALKVRSATSCRLRVHSGLGTSFSHSDWSRGCASIPANSQLRTWENLTGQVWVSLGSCEIGRAQIPLTQSCLTHASG